MAGMLKITQVRSGIGRPADQRKTLLGLGLTRMHKTVLLRDTEAIRGMVRKVQHLVTVEPAEAQPAQKTQSAQKTQTARK